MYKPLLNREPLRMREVIERLQDAPARKKGMKWQKKDYRYIAGKKKFRIYSMRLGQTTKYKLAFNESSYLWQEVSSPGRSSWEMCDAGTHLIFRMLIDGVVRTNSIKQKKDVKS